MTNGSRGLNFRPDDRHTTRLDNGGFGDAHPCGGGKIVAILIAIDLRIRIFAPIIFCSCCRGRAFGMQNLLPDAKEISPGDEGQLQNFLLQKISADNRHGRVDDVKRGLEDARPEEDGKFHAVRHFCKTSLVIAAHFEGIFKRYEFSVGYETAWN